MKKVLGIFLILSLLVLGFLSAREAGGAFKYSLIRQYIDRVYQLITDKYLFTIEDEALVKSAWAEINKMLVSELSAPRSLEEFDLKFDYLAELYPEEISRLGGAAVKGMVNALKDPYSGLLDSKERSLWEKMRLGESFPGLGLELAFKKGGYEVVGTLPASPARRAKLKPGDQLLAVNQKQLSGLSFFEVLKLLEAAGENSAKVRLQLKRGKQFFEAGLKKEKLKLLPPETKLFRSGGKVYGYLKLNYFSFKTPGEVREALQVLEQKGSAALLLDLRDNPGGDFDSALMTASFFVSGQPIVLVEANGEEQTPYYTDKPVLYGGKMAVLINSGTASAAEILVTAFKSSERAILLGSRSYGKNLAQTVYSLSGNYALVLTTQRFLTAEGEDFGGVGIAPDLEVPPATDDLILIKKAIQVLQEELEDD